MGGSNDSQECWFCQNPYFPLERYKKDTDTKICRVCGSKL